MAVWVGREGAGVPTKCLMLLLPCTARGPCSVPSPRDSQALPLCCLAQSGALRDTAGLCPARACREGAGCPLQASPASCWLCSTHGSCGTHGTWGTQGSWLLLLQPWISITWGPHGCAHPSAFPPRGSRGWGKWPQDYQCKGENPPSLEHPGSKACPWDEGPHWQVLGGLGR